MTRKWSAALISVLKNNSVAIVDRRKWLQRWFFLDKKISLGGIAPNQHSSPDLWHHMSDNCGFWVSRPTKNPLENNHILIGIGILRTNILIGPTLFSVFHRRPKADCVNRDNWDNRDYDSGNRSLTSLNPIPRRLSIISVKPSPLSNPLSNPHVSYIYHTDNLLNSNQ